MTTDQRIVFYVTKEEKKALDKISEETGARMSELMRRAFKQWLRDQKGQSPNLKFKSHRE
jgi:Ribbon-helix-helix protein, copG family